MRNKSTLTLLYSFALATSESLKTVSLKKEVRARIEGVLGTIVGLAKNALDCKEGLEGGTIEAASEELLVILNVINQEKKNAKI